MVRVVMGVMTMHVVRRWKRRDRRAVAVLVCHVTTRRRRSVVMLHVVSMVIVVVVVLLMMLVSMVHAGVTTTAVGSALMCGWGVRMVWHRRRCPLLLVVVEVVVVGCRRWWYVHCPILVASDVFFLLFFFHFQHLLGAYGSLYDVRRCGQLIFLVLDFVLFQRSLPSALSRWTLVSHHGIPLSGPHGRTWTAAAHTLTVMVIMRRHDVP